MAGGAITNDFALAMWLTAAWMGLAGFAATAVALHSRAFRWPVLGGYVVTAAVAGAYLGSSVVFDDVVDEQVATAPAAMAAMATGGERGPANVRLRRGRFESVRHPATGAATAIRLAAAAACSR